MNLPSCTPDAPEHIVTLTLLVLHFVEDTAEKKEGAIDAKAGSKRSAGGEAGDDDASAKRVKTEEAATEVCMFAHPGPAYAV